MKLKRPSNRLAKCPRTGYVDTFDSGDDVPGEQFAYARDGVVGDAGQHLAEIGFRIEAVELGRADQGVKLPPRARLLNPILQTDNSSGPVQPRAGRVRRCCCRSRCVRHHNSARARPSARGRSESPPLYPTCAKASATWSRTTGAEKRAAPSTASGVPGGVLPVAGRESLSQSRTARRFGLALHSPPAMHVPVASRKTCAARAPSTPLPECGPRPWPSPWRPTHHVLYVFR
jgi:hypothetical protein